MEQQELIPHLFRTEYRKITAVLCKTFGIEHIETAEDIASDTFLAAMESWPYKGLPPNPSAWLYTVAKNKAKNHLHHAQIFTQKVAPNFAVNAPRVEENIIDLSEKNIADSQLQMLFAICHPSIPAESQIGLALRILCGFGIDEIATAFLGTKETINKRLFRAKEKLRQEHVEIAFPDNAQINTRLDAVLTTLYLLFNEGYYSESHDAVLRKDLCLEAMRMLILLLDYEPANLPRANALLALMCFHASRFEARVNKNGEFVLYEDQDTTLWNQELIQKGIYFFKQASQGESLSKYHLEAGIAYWHTIKEDSSEKWETILQLYNQLLQIAYSPVAALNRTFALSKVRGNAQAITEAEKLALNSNHFYFTLLGVLYKETDRAKARQHFQKALTLAKTKTDKQTIQKKLDMLEFR